MRDLSKLLVTLAVLLLAFAAPVHAQTINRIEPARVCPGDDFALVGRFGIEPSRYSIRIASLTLRHSDGGITWDSRRIESTLPAGSLAPGTYALELWTHGRRQVSYPSFVVGCDGSGPSEPTRELTPGAIRGPAAEVRGPAAQLRLLRIEIEAGPVRVGDVVQLCVQVENSGDTEAFVVPRVPALTREVARGCGAPGGPALQYPGLEAWRIPPSRTVRFGTFVEITPHPIRNGRFRHTVMLYNASELGRGDPASTDLPFWRDSRKSDNAKEFSIAVDNLPYLVRASVPWIKVHKTCDSFSPGDWFFLYGLHSPTDEALESNWRRLPPRGTRDVDGGRNTLRPSPGVDTTATLRRLPPGHDLEIVVSGYDCDHRSGTTRIYGSLPASLRTLLLEERGRCSGEEPGEFGAATHEQLLGKLRLSPEQWQRGGVFTVRGDCGTDRDAFEMTVELESTLSR